MIMLLLNKLTAKPPRRGVIDASRLRIYILKKMGQFYFLNTPAHLKFVHIRRTWSVFNVMLNKMLTKILPLVDVLYRLYMSRHILIENRLECSLFINMTSEPLNIQVVQVSPLGYQLCLVCLQSGSDWPQMGQIRDFFRSDFSTFWRPAICLIWGQSDPL